MISHNDLKQLLRQTATATATDASCRNKRKQQQQQAERERERAASIMEQRQRMEEHWITGSINCKEEEKSQARPSYSISIPSCLEEEYSKFVEQHS
jgi:hypothetical protein